MVGAAPGQVGFDFLHAQIPGGVIKAGSLFGHTGGLNGPSPGNEQANHTTMGNGANV